MPALEGAGGVQPIALPRRETAVALGISERLLYDLTHPRGPIRAVRLGTRLVYPVAEIQRHLAAELAKATGPASTPAPTTEADR